jgi:hypothetical protein
MAKFSVQELAELLYVSMAWLSVQRCTGAVLRGPGVEPLKARRVIVEGKIGGGNCLKLQRTNGTAPELLEVYWVHFRRRVRPMRSSRFLLTRSTPGVYGQRAIGSVQRRRDRDHDHHHGVGDEGAGWRRPGRVGAAPAGVSQLRPEFPLCCYLLEEPPHAACIYRRDGCMPWANLHLLFWLSIFPFATGWMGENHFTAVPTALYGVVLLMAGIAYYLLQQAIIRAQGLGSILKKAIGRDWKGKLSPVLYIAAIVAALRFSWIAQAVYVIAALIWLIPDRRIEKRLCHVAGPVD